MSDVEMLRDTITPKSDQLNADSLLAGPITVTVTDVRRGSTEQPIDIHISHGNGYRSRQKRISIELVAFRCDGIAKHFNVTHKNVLCGKM